MEIIPSLISIILFCIIILSIKSENNNSNIISLKFKTYYPYTNNYKYNPSYFDAVDYYNNIHMSKIYLELGVGNESDFEENTNQILNIIVDLNEIIFYTTNIYFKKYTIENNNLLCKYNSSKSKTLSQSDGFYPIDGIKTLCSYARESFKVFTDLSLKKYNITNINFVNTINHNISNICGNIGLTYLHSESHAYNFIAQLHSIFDLSEFSLLFNYSSKDSDNGIFIVGSMPHIYLPERYHIDNLVYIYSTNMKEPTILLDELQIEEYKFDNNEEQLTVKITPDIEGIEFPELYFKKIEELFFQEFYNKSICNVEICNRIFRVIQCDASMERFGEKNIKSFPKITFNKNKSNNFSISFNGEDLFYYKNNKYFFKIVENVLDKYFVFGRILFKKYTTVLNPDKRQIFFYSNKEDKENENINIETESDLKYIFIIIGYILLIIIIFILGICFGKQFFKKRAKRAYELNDDFEYRSTKEDENDSYPFSQ